MKELTKTNRLKTKIWNELKMMLPYNELTFSIICREKLTAIKLQMLSIYWEFEEEIQSLFNWRI